MPHRYRFKVFVITGASDGVGAELARQLAGRGHRLVLAGRDETRLRAVAVECDQRGSRVLAVPTDVSIEQDCRRLIERAIEGFGQIDVLINSACLAMHADFDGIEDAATFEAPWRVNCLGTILCTRFAYPHLRAMGTKKPGLVVGICSMAGRTGFPGYTSYCASKFAQAGFLDALRREAQRDGIGVLTVYPDSSADEAAEVSGRDAPASRQLEDCARSIVRAIRKRKRELVFKRRSTIGQWLKLVLPRLTIADGRTNRAPR